MKTKVASLALLLTLIFPIMAKSQVKIQQTAGRDALGEFAPEFARLNDDILFGEVWSRNDLLSLRDRSIVTVVALMSQGLTDSSFKYHLESAKKNGVTRTEIAEILTHAAFYAGWPKAWAAFRMAKEVWTDGNADSVAAGSLEAYAQTIIFPVGKPNDAYAKYFIGQSYTAPVVTDGVPVVNVSSSRAAATTGTCTRQRKAAVRHSYAWAVAATIRNGAKSRWNCVPGMLSIFRQA